MIVIDCSLTMAWCFDEEKTEATDGILNQLAGTEAVVPAIWPIEVANVLMVGERRGRLTAARAEAFVQLLNALQIIVDIKTPDKAFSETRSLARTYNLSVYDAAYLELALRLQAGLATLDEPLKKAAQAAGVPVL